MRVEQAPRDQYVRLRLDEAEELADGDEPAIARDRARAAEIERINVLLPAFGMPSRPTSASTRSSSLSSNSSPSSPLVHWRGARLVLDLK